MGKIIYLFIAYFLTLNGFSANSKVTGCVKDALQNPVSMATVRLLAVDSSFIKGAVTDDKGTFYLENVKEGNYILLITCIGYQNTSLNFKMPNTDFQLPLITLQNDEVALETVTVTGTSLIQKKDHLLVIPDKQQIKHAFSGYDLLYNLMIPGITVDRRKGTVTTSRGSATLYINGVKADFREVQNLRPKDIERIEYFDMPTDQYLGDAASINYITKEYQTGGYISLDGEQNIGYTKGDYNVGAKISHENTNYLVFGGYNMRKYDGVETSKNEEFNFNDYSVYRNTATEDANYKNDQQYMQFKVNNMTKKRSLSGFISFVHDNTPHNDQNEMLAYQSELGNSSIHSVESINQESYKPAVSLDGIFYLNDKQRLRVMLNGSYSKNEYQRNYAEQSQLYNTNVDEDLYSFSAVGTYNIKLKHNNSLGGNIQHYHNIASSEYTGNTISSQHLWMGETMAFLSYTQDIGKKFSFTISPGVSLLNYQLNHSEDDKHRFWTFRTNTWIRYRLNSKHQFTLGLAIGNEQADISYLNTVNQTVDSLIVKRGNPYLDNTKIYSYFFRYLAQIGQANIQLYINYRTYPNNISYDYYIENNKLINSYKSDGSFHNLRLEYLCSYRFSDNLRANAILRYEHMNVPDNADLKEDNIFASLDVNYFIKAFAINAYAKTTERKLDQTSFVYTKNPATYGLSVRYSGKNWMAEVGTENPFTKHQHYREYADYCVYRYNQVQTSRIYQQTAYVKLAYTFDFGKNTSRENNDVDRSINSAILKAR